MNPTERQIHYHLKKDWENFPFKLDYLFYLLHLNHRNISDIHLLRVGNSYSLYRFRSNGDMHNKFEYADLTIDQNELHQHLRISKSLKEPIDFSYATSIFTEKYDFRCNTTPTGSGDLIIFRFLDSSAANLSLIHLMKVSTLTNLKLDLNSIKQDDKFRTFNQEFIQLIEKYNLYDELQQSLNDKNPTNEKRLKI
jgi:hypothetical protein